MAHNASERHKSVTLSRPTYRMFTRAGSPKDNEDAFACCLCQREKSAMAESLVSNQYGWSPPHAGGHFHLAMMQDGRRPPTIGSYGPNAPLRAGEVVFSVVLNRKNKLACTPSTRQESYRRP